MMSKFYKQKSPMIEVIEITNENKSMWEERYHQVQYQAYIRSTEEAKLYGTTQPEYDRVSFTVGQHIAVYEDGQLYYYDDNLYQEFLKNHDEVEAN